MNEMIEHIYSGDRTRRIAIFRRPSGSFGYQQEYFFRNDYFSDEVVEGWASLGECASYYDQVETAKADVMASVRWLATR
ncbi:MAG: hypothetical protein ACREPD_08025 [Stenotrophomonas sp.]|uniref:hypothetical protein n=1 Tax=Stenotrophomonas sp. TaxID=69392 RepID=UPI003D6C88AF